MTKSEISLKLTIEAIEKGYLTISQSDNNTLGDAISTLYNRIYRGLDANCGSDS